MFTSDSLAEGKNKKINYDTGEILDIYSSAMTRDSKPYMPIKLGKKKFSNKDISFIPRPTPCQ